jgi:hypothetical protein
MDIKMNNMMNMNNMNNKMNMNNNFNNMNMMKFFYMKNNDNIFFQNNYNNINNINNMKSHSYKINKINNSNNNNFNVKINNNNIFNLKKNEINNFSQKNTNPFNHQKEILNKLINKNFSLAPNYVNGLNINNCTISKNNRALLEKLSKIAKYVLVTPLEIIYKEQYGIFTKSTKEREKCPICLCEFYDDIIEDNPQNLILKDLNEYIKHEIDTIKLFKCDDHFYHIECLLNYIQGKDGFKCAICQKIYGIIKGNMPNGTMKAKIDKSMRCAGFPKDQTIVISYSFNDGYIDGHRYTGTYRTAYLPYNEEGIITLGMLKVAFDRKLTFVVGTSVTTGQKNTVVWNGIHHKTSTTGGTSNYGYPDKTYFNRVQEELASKGITKEDFKNGELKSIANQLIHKY